jgi:MFS family permease
VSQRGGAWLPLRERDFALLWIGQTVSLVGDGVFTVALPLQTLALTPRPTALAAVIASRAVPRVLFLVVSGAFADRLPRRSTALVSDAARGLAVGSIALLAATGTLEVWHLIVMAVAFGTADAFFFPTLTAIVPEILPEEQLVQGSALNASSRLVAESLVGPVLGGLVVAGLGTVWGFGLDAGTFAVSTACLLAMRARPTAAERGSSVLSDAMEGFRFTRSQRWLWASLLGAGVANFAGFAPLGVLLPLVVRDELHGSATALGLVLAAFGAGGTAAALVAGRRGAPRRMITAMWSGWALGSAFVVGVALAPTLVLAGLAATGMGFGLEYGNVLWTPLMQKLVPRRLLGRVSALDWLFSLSLTPLGIAVAGPVATAIGAPATMAIGGSVALCSGIVLFVPGVRDPESRLEHGSRP